MVDLPVDQIDHAFLILFWKLKLNYLKLSKLKLKTRIFLNSGAFSLSGG